MRHPSSEPRSIVRYAEHAEPRQLSDRIVVEEPLEVRVFGEQLTTTMRTPGHDRELIAGWLLHEGLIESAADVSGLFRCSSPDTEDHGNVYEVVPAAGMAERLKARDPALTARTVQSSCGVCGRQTLDDLIRRRCRTHHAHPWPHAVLRRLLEQCGADQVLYRDTGAAHGAVLGHINGTLSLTREDIGRHNAVDKLIGRLLLDGRLPVSAADALLVSSRASFEIVHKAHIAGFSVVLSISAPSTLAIELAVQSGMILAGFFRSGAFNVYAGADRVSDLPP